VSTRPITSAKAARGLRANSFAALLILLVEYGLGIWVNLYGRLPASDHGANLAAGFARAVADGPVGLSIHAVLGAALVISAAAALARSILVRRVTLIAVTSVALLAVVAAALSGARFVGNGDNAASMSMAVAAGTAIAAYALVLFVTASAQAASRS
jgi:hypothetical protein